jgi:hypothetical protein
MWKYLGARILAGLALVIFLAGATPSFAANEHLDQLASRIGKAMSAELGYPSDLSFYQDRVTYGHNFDAAQDHPSNDFIPKLSAKQPLLRRLMPDAKLTITREVASGNTIVLISALTGTLPDGVSYFSQTATFFTIENNHIRGMEVWMNLADGAKLLDYIRKEMAKPAPQK